MTLLHELISGKEAATEKGNITEWFRNEVNLVPRIHGLLSQRENSWRNSGVVKIFSRRNPVVWFLVFVQ